MSFQIKYLDDFKTIRQKLKIWRDFENYLSSLEGDDSTLLRLMMMRPVIDNRTDRGYERDLYDRYKYARETGWTPDAASAEPANEPVSLASRTHSSSLSPLRTSTPPPLPPLPPTPPPRVQPQERSTALGPIRIPITVAHRAYLLASISHAPQAQASTPTPQAQAAAPAPTTSASTTVTAPSVTRDSDNEDLNDDNSYDYNPTEDSATPTTSAPRATSRRALPALLDQALETQCPPVLSQRSPSRKAATQERTATARDGQALIATERAQSEPQSRARDEVDAQAPERISNFQKESEARMQALEVAAKLAQIATKLARRGAPTRAARAPAPASESAPDSESAPASESAAPTPAVEVEHAVEVEASPAPEAALQALVRKRARNKEIGQRLAAARKQKKAATSAPPSPQAPASKQPNKRKRESSENSRRTRQSVRREKAWAHMEGNQVTLSPLRELK